MFGMSQPKDSGNSASHMKSFMGEAAMLITLRGESLANDGKTNDEYLNMINEVLSSCKTQTDRVILISALATIASTFSASLDILYENVNNGDDRKLSETVLAQLALVLDY